MHAKTCAMSAMVVVALTIGAPATRAQDGGCAALAWPVERELRWMAGKAQSVVAGETLKAPPEAAMSVVLSPAATQKLAIAPTGRPRKVSADAYGGVVNFDGGATGLTQISLSVDGWIDVIQNGAALEPVAFTGSDDCDSVRRSVRYEIGAGPFTLQLSNVPRNAVRVAIAPAEGP
jgi:hypothetical protein